MFWICDQICIESTGMFYLLLSSAYSLETFSVSQDALPVNGLGVHKELEGTELEWVTITDPRAIPDHLMSCSAIKLETRERKGG